jgi:hypothetical protein
MSLETQGAVVATWATWPLQVSLEGQRPRQRHICGQVAPWHRGITTVAVWHRRCRAAADLAQASCEHTPGRGGPGRAQAGRGRVLCRLLGQGLMAGIGSLGETPRPLVAAAGLRPQIGRPDRGRQPIGI